MAAAPSLFLLLAFVVLQICLVPTNAWWFRSNRLSFTATPAAFINGLPVQNIALTCHIGAGAQNIAPTVTGLRIRRRANSNTPLVDVAQIDSQGAARSFIAGITATGTITNVRTGSNLTVVLPSTDMATITAQLGDYYCFYVSTSTLGRRFANYTIAMRDLNVNELLSIYVNGLRTAWPRGSYALLKPETGCPIDPAFNHQQQAYLSVETEMTTNVAFDAAVGNIHLSSPVFTTIEENNKPQAYFRFCPTDNTLGMSDWPAGRYCINKGAGNCPTGFTAGAITFPAETSSTAIQASNGGPGTGLNVMNFCCRSETDDNLVTTAIALPTSTPFYLYPQHPSNTCQTVAGMTATLERIEIDTEDSLMVTTTGSVPRNIITAGPPTAFTLYFCHYVMT